MAMHDLKSDSAEFAKLKSGEQTFLLRLNENFQMNETICVREFDPFRGQYSDAHLVFRITSIQDGERSPSVLSPRFAIISIVPAEETEQL
jgi:hypothetical protein